MTMSIPEVVISHEREARISFRPLTFDDIPQLVAWLGDPDVQLWYDEGELTVENITSKYRDMIEGKEQTFGFIHQFDGIDAGFIQGYLIQDHEDYARQIDLPPDTGAADLMIGNRDFRGGGWAVPLLHAFYRRVVFGQLGAKHAIIAPSPKNARGIHVYAKAGFQHIKTVAIVDDEPGNTGDEYVMLLRDDIADALGRIS